MPTHRVLAMLAALLFVCPYPAASLSEFEIAGRKPALVAIPLGKDSLYSPWLNELDYPNQVVGKLLFGGRNILFGWTDVLLEPRNAVKFGEHWLVGVGRGVRKGFLNTVGGFGHLITFPLPQIDFQLPDGGSSLPR